MATAKKSTTTALITWDEELAKQAQIAAAVEESTATGQFFSLRGGILSFNDAPLPNNEMAVVILDGLLENVYYEGAYNPENIQGPKCFAFAREEKTMAPHKIVIDGGHAQNDGCASCPKNEWGSADTGRGKACRNTRRLALIPAGTFKDGQFEAFTDASQFAAAGIAYMKLPVTSVKGYAAFVKQIASALKRPPHAIFTRVTVRPDPASQFKVNFEALSKVPDELMATIMARHDEAVEAIEFPYSAFEEPEKPAARGGKAQPPSRGKRY
jgi:hypothetical protein